MNITAYFQLSRIGLPLGNGEYRIQPTGVGAHIIHMLQAFSARPDVRLTALLPSGDLDSNHRIPADFPMAAMPLAPLPYSRRSVEMKWLLFNSPPIEKWLPDCDWVYCPQETVVAVRKARLAVTVHDAYYLEEFFPWKGRIDRLRGRLRWKTLLHAIRKRASLVLSVSEFTKSRLVDLLDFDPRQIFVVGNPIDDFYFSDPPPEAPPAAPLPPSPYLLVVGGLAWKKGGDYLLNAARELARTRPDMRIVVCGVSDPVYRAQAASLANMILLDYEPPHRYLRLLKNARALLMLSRYEGFGVPAVEAMAAGTPAIVSRFASLPEVAGDAGIIVDADRGEEVVTAIQRIDADAEYRAGAVARGRARAANFRRDAVVERLFNAMKNVDCHR